MAPATTLQVPVQKRQFWAEFFGLYRRLPVLWDAQHQFYKYRTCKYEAYDKLVDKLREIEPQADRQDVLRKINIFRTNYRRERARVLSSDTRGKEYKSTLWYYDMLSFLRTQEKPKKGKTQRATLPMGALDYTIQHNEVSNNSWPQLDYSTNAAALYECKRHSMEDYLTEESTLATAMWQKTLAPPAQQASTATETQSAATAVAKDELQTPPLPPLSPMLSPKLETPDEETTTQSPTPPSPPPPPAKEPSPAPLPESEEPQTQNPKPMLTLRNLSPETKTFTDDGVLSPAAAILAKSWAIQYDEMAPEQKIYARKAIAEILFEGCMGNLGNEQNSGPRQNF